MKRGTWNINPETGRECIAIDAERFAEDLPRKEYLRLLRVWFRVVLPMATFDCKSLTLEGE